MSLTNAFTTPATGDSYVTVPEADAALIWSESWGMLDTAAKEARIKAASFMADQRRFLGVKANDPQAMQLPRFIEGNQDYLGAEPQQRAARAYVLALLEYWLAKVPTGLQQYSLADESIRHTALIEPDEARNALFDFTEG